MANKGNGKSSPRTPKNNSSSSWATLRPNSASPSWATLRPNSRSPASVRSKMSLSNRSGGRLFPGPEEIKFLSMLRLSNAPPRNPPPRGRKPPLRKSRMGISTSVVRKLFENNNTPKKSQKRQRSISPARNSGSRPGRRPGKEPKRNTSNNINKRNNSNSN